MTKKDDISNLYTLVKYLMVIAIIGLLLTIPIAITTIASMFKPTQTPAPIPTPTLSTPTVLREPDFSSPQSTVDSVNDPSVRRLKIEFGRDSQPYSFLGDDGQINGFDIALLQEIEIRLYGNTNEKSYIPIQTDEKIKESNNFDIRIGAISGTPERCSVFYCLTFYDQNPYISDNPGILIRSSDNVTGIFADNNGALHFINDDSFCSYIKGKRVGFIRNTTSDQSSNLNNGNQNQDPKTKFITDHCPSDPQIPVPTEAVNKKDLLNKISNNTLDAYITDSKILKFHANFTSGFKVINLDNLVSAEKIPTEKYTFFFPATNHTGLREIISLVLQDMKCDNGKFDEIYKEYFQDASTFIVDANTCSALKSNPFLNQLKYRTQKQ